MTSRMLLGSSASPELPRKVALPEAVGRALSWSGPEGPQPEPELVMYLPRPHHSSVVMMEASCPEGCKVLVGFRSLWLWAIPLESPLERHLTGPYRLSLCSHM